MSRHSRWRTLFALLAALLLFPGVTLAQNFPSQSGGGSGEPPAGSSGFPAAGTQQPPAGQGGIIQFQRFGFSLEWGPQWTLTDHAGDVTSDVEGIVLQNGASVVVVMGLATSLSPQEIVTNIATNPPPWSFDNVIIDEPDHAAAYFTTGDPELGGFIAARTLSSSSAMAIIWNFPVAQYESEFAAFVALLDGLR